ncbi:MAG: CsgG/HfaB family protein [Longimicrobiales bacterium]
MRLHRAPIYALLAVLAGCATTTTRAPQASPALAQLEATVARDRGNLDARVQLAAAYLQANRSQESAQLLEAVMAQTPHPALAEYFLGLTYDRLNRAADARRYYASYLQRSPGAGLQRTVRGRMAALDRAELESAVRSALAQERTLANTNPAPGVVGVFPFLNTAPATLAPLGRALAELITVDLSQTTRIRIVERAQVQRLLDEIRLAQSGSVDPATAARAGRLLGAGRIVQGRLDGTEAALRMQAAVVAVPGAGRTPAPVTQQGALRNLLTMQNNMALALYRELGVELTVAERERVLREPTQNVQALLAFGMGLEAQDAGRPAEAATHFRRAATLDPGFSEANAAAERSEAMVEAANVSPADMVAQGARELAPPAAPGTAAASINVRDRFLGVDGMVPNLTRKDPVSELLGTEGLQRRALLELLILRPR